MSTFLKDPSATLDYQLVWTDWLASGETISSHTVTADDGITVVTSTASTTAVTAWVTGGEDDEDYDVVCQVTTTDGRVDERTLKIKVRQR